MERLTLSAPGKTFLVGEYLALSGGPSLVLSTGPRFELVASRHGARTAPFPKGSPADKFLEKNPGLHAEFPMLEFRDPHAGKGGLGASSAQFALAYILAKGWEKFSPATCDWKELLADYRSVAWSGEGSAPSGADVVAQLSGGVTWFDGTKHRAEVLEWAFPSLSFTLLRTGTKLATHEHLRTRQAAPQEALRHAVGEARNALETRDQTRLVGAVRQAGEALAESGLVAETTRELLSGIKARPGLFLAAKGCGALGADVVLTLHERSSGPEVEAWAGERGLEICGTESSLERGLRVTEGERA